MSFTINRTKVELKRKGVWELFYEVDRYQSYQSGIETTSFSLNQIDPDYYQSYQSGIETISCRAVPIVRIEVTINRTKVELKHRYVQGDISSSGPINRTKVELKLLKGRRHSEGGVHYQSYQSGIETNYSSCKRDHGNSINRTKVELKPD